MSQLTVVRWTFEMVLHCFYQADIIQRDITHASVDLQERDRRHWFASEWRRMNTFCSFIQTWPLSITSGARRGETRWE